MSFMGDEIVFAGLSDGRKWAWSSGTVGCSGIFIGRRGHVSSPFNEFNSRPLTILVASLEQRSIAPNQS